MALTHIKYLAVLFIALLSTATRAEWAYATDTDQMTSKSVKQAYIESGNSLSLQFPYSGVNHGRLRVRQHPKYGLDVIVEIDKGQILCHASDECAATVRFDDEPPIRFGARPAASHESTIIFLRDPTRFIARAAKAKRILVQLLIYQNGNQVLTFQSATPLKWQAAPARKTSGEPADAQNAAMESAGDCSASATGISGTGECGRLYAECTLASSTLTQPARGVFMTRCTRAGTDAAWAEWRDDRDSDPKAAPWPKPPDNFFIAK